MADAGRHEIDGVLFLLAEAISSVSVVSLSVVEPKAHGTSSPDAWVWTACVCQ
jgi:hypothetical protein